MKIYCPLMSYRRNSSLSVPCEKDDCMWWDDENQCCLVASYLKSQINPPEPVIPFTQQSRYEDDEEDYFTTSMHDLMGNYGIDTI